MKQLIELRYNFVEKKATIIVSKVAENASEIADAVNKFFVDGSADCIGYEHRPLKDTMLFFFRVENASVLDTLTDVFCEHLTRYER